MEAASREKRTLEVLLQLGSRGHLWCAALGASPVQPWADLLKSWRKSSTFTHHGIELEEKISGNR